MQGTALWGLHPRMALTLPAVNQVNLGRNNGIVEHIPK